ncbi:MAG: DUF6268 family outer membrane beta-barrel protein [Verrucomicrobiota bacterium]
MRRFRCRSDFRLSGGTGSVLASIKSARCIVVFALFFSSLPVLAEEEKSDWFKPILSLAKSGEYQVEETYVGGASVSRGAHTVSDFDEHDVGFRFILTPRVKLGILRLGVEWEHFSFGFSGKAPLPNTFQSANLVLGLDTQISDSILMRFEVQPGFYGTNNADANQMNVPFIIGGSYIYNPNVQIIAGISFDIERDYPVIPAAGVRWKLSRQWVLNAVLPTPRLEYEATKAVTLYAGANIKQTNFRMEPDFGTSHGIKRLNNAVLSYSEVRGGIGGNWKLASFATLTVEAGYQPYRNFDFYRSNVRFHETDSAPYVMISLHGAF